MKEPQTITHGFYAVYDKESEILILGSAPSVKSREAGFFYMHPQNRFWKVLSAVFQDEDFISKDIKVKANALLRHNIALYDVIESCKIVGSADNTITEVEPAFEVVNKILTKANIEKIVLAGNKAYKLFKYHKEGFNIPDYVEIMAMPSTSPANAAYTIEKLVENWGKIP